MVCSSRLYPKLMCVPIPGPLIHCVANDGWADIPSNEQAIDSPKPLDNLWDQVDDFKWLKAEHSPNWDTLPADSQVVDEVWRDIVPGGPGWSLDDILKATKVGRS